MDDRPIGIFDSGLGGLTVLKQVARLLPNEDLIYLGDNARVPYGNRTKETVVSFSFEDANFLLTKQVKCMVIACNTASALAGDELKSKLNIPVFDVITPALEDARKYSNNGVIGVIGTRGTISSGAYDVSFSRACPLLVPFIEEGVITGEPLKLIAKGYLADFKKDGIDTLIMGCTHYPIIKDVIEKVIDANIRLVDPGVSVSRELVEYLTKNKMLNPQESVGKHEYFVTDYTEHFVKVAEMFLGHKIEDNLKKVKLQ